MNGPVGSRFDILAIEAATNIDENRSKFTLPMAQVANFCNSIKDKVTITQKDIFAKKQFLQEDKTPRNSAMAAEAATSGKDKKHRKTRHLEAPKGTNRAVGFLAQ